MDEGEQYKREQEFLRAVGKRIRQFRKGRRLSQEELAFASGITQHYLSQVEQGKRNVSLITIRALANALEMPLSEFFSNIEQMTGADDT